MAIVEDGIIKINGDAIGLVSESKYPVPSIINVEYERQSKYVVK